MLTDTNKDYRNTTNCPVLVDVALKKCALERKIQQDHKRAKIMYNFVHDKQDVYFKPFSEIYNCKCAYCGAWIGISDIRLFEVDHFICEDRQIKPCDIERVKTMFSNNVNLNQIVAFVNSKTLESDLTTEEISRLNTIRVKLIGRRK